MTRVVGKVPESKVKRKFEFTKEMRENLFSMTSKDY